MPFAITALCHTVDPPPVCGTVYIIYMAAVAVGGFDFLGLTKAVPCLQSEYDESLHFGEHNTCKGLQASIPFCNASTAFF